MRTAAVRAQEGDAALRRSLLLESVEPSSLPPLGVDVPMPRLIGDFSWGGREAMPLFQEVTTRCEI